MEPSGDADHVPALVACMNHQEEIMHRDITRQLAADHIRGMHAKADDERLARRAGPC